MRLVVIIFPASAAPTRHQKKKERNTKFRVE